MGDRQARIRPGGFTVNRILPFLILIILQPFASGSSPSPRVKTGADLLLEKRPDILRGKRIGLITNQSGRLSSGEYLLDALIAHGIEVTALFGPEHGIRGTEPAWESVPDSVDGKTQIPIFSLYGRIRKPTPAMLKNVDLLLFDIQDGVSALRNVPYIICKAFAPQSLQLLIIPVQHVRSQDGTFLGPCFHAQKVKSHNPNTFNWVVSMLP